jgi:hypothetical protein
MFAFLPNMFCVSYVYEFWFCAHVWPTNLISSPMVLLITALIFSGSHQGDPLQSSCASNNGMKHAKLSARIADSFWNILMTTRVLISLISLNFICILACFIKSCANIVFCFAQSSWPTPVMAFQYETVCPIPWQNIC